MGVQEQLSGYQRAARRKWPHDELMGDGRYALRSTCVSTWRVCLFIDPMAREERNEKCGYQCKGRDAHVLVELIPLPEPTPVRNVRKFFDDDE
jgi:hypothetical protein